MARRVHPTAPSRLGLTTPRRIAGLRRVTHGLLARFRRHAAVDDSEPRPGRLRFVRKYTPTKWTRTADGALSADALYDLRTEKGELSLWVCQEQEGRAGILEVARALALPLGSEKDHLRTDKFALLHLNEEVVVALGLDFSPTPNGARTLQDDLRARHWDMAGIRSADLPAIAEAFAESADSPERRHSISALEVQTILADAVDKELLPIDHPRLVKVRAKVEPLTAKGKEAAMAKAAEKQQK
jgi:hypothetical protein